MTDIPMLARLNAELAHPWGSEPPKRTKPYAGWGLVPPTTDEWAPGDPLHAWQGRFHELIEEHPLPTYEECAPCDDAARWPVPLGRDPLHDLDELDALDCDSVEKWLAEQRDARKVIQR